MSRVAENRYCLAANPTLGDYECDHPHTKRVELLARSFAERVSDTTPGDDLIGTFMDDAGAIADDFPDATEWTFTEWVVPSREPGLSVTFTLNGVPYVVQESEFEPSHPVSRSEYESWFDDEEDPR